MADAVKIVVIDGVRYREDEAPKKKGADSKEATPPSNKARSASNKKG